MPSQVSIEEIAMLLGQKDIEILLLQKQLTALQKQVAESTPKPDVQPIRAVE